MSRTAALDRLHRFNPFRGRAGGPEVRRPDLRGVRVTGSFSDERGWGAAGRGYVRALQHLGMPISIHDVSAPPAPGAAETSGALPAHDSTDVNLVCVDAGQHFALLSELGESFFAGHYNIGAWAWELPRFPDGWYNRFAYYDEIWVGTSFVASAIAPVAPVPVIRVPPVVTATCGSRERGRASLAAHAGECLFLFVFDVHSQLLRKNPHAAIAAFRKAFPRRGKARLILKSINAAADPEGYAELRELAGDAAIEFHDGYWHTGAFADLIAACDAYVSLHRSEGTGLTLAEAMAAGKPVIATDWSGTTDFADASNSYPVAYELTSVTRSVGQHRAGETWAEPDIDHAAAMMTAVVDDPVEAARRGAAARRRIERDYSARAIADIVAARLDVIASRDLAGTLRREVSAFVHGHRDPVDDIRAIAARILPPDDVVAVLSGGDGSMLDLGRPAWHFPEARPGVHAAHDPADSQAAVTALEDARQRGARFLLVPGTSFWWLEHYAGFRRYLGERYRCIWRNEGCAIFDLRTPVPGATA